MDTKMIAMVAVVVVIAVAALLLLMPAGPKQVACTMEAKLCPDGSAVGRTGPNCEFAPCPTGDQCECPAGYRQEGEVCNPECYYSQPPCLAPSFLCTSLLGNDSDEHGCIGSAGYSWCEAKQKCLRVWEEPCSSCVPDPNKVCTRIYMPVCGMDGVTYGNSCTAEAACAEIAYQGECVGGGVVGVNPGGGTGMANPASVYCEEQGGTLEIADTPDGQVGMCHFADQTCEEWALFRSNATNCTGADGTLAKTYCKPEQRNVQACTMEYGPVCGWFDSSINCLAYPCAQTASNPCMACADPKVEYYTGGECPEVGGR